LRSSATGYLSRTPASASNLQKFTWSGWVKRGKLASFTPIFCSNGGNTTDSNFFMVQWLNTDTIAISGALTDWRITTQVFRDPSAWYHIVFAVDTTLATAANRILLYINGVQVTAFGTNSNPAQNLNTSVNNTSAHYISTFNGSGNPSDMYLAEVNFIDGQALTPSSFGETDSITGVWKPKAYSGTYGTNGFELNFSDNSNNTAATIGKDYSGNGNNWTPNNISVTAGATYDSMTDVPTLTSATAANYCVLNPLTYGYTAPTITSGNLNISGGVFATAVSTFLIPQSGKYYAEIQITSTPQNNTNEEIGISPATSLTTITRAYASNGQYYNGSSFVSFGNAWSTNDIIGIALNVDSSQISFYRNGTQEGTTQSFTFTGTDYLISLRCNNGTTTTYVANFGQRPFTYTPPTGFVALNTYNLPASTITNGAAYMAATTYTGTGATQSISNAVNGISMQPDWVWFKRRGAAENHWLTDSVRGSTKGLFSNLTDAEATRTDQLTSFNSNGFSLGADAAGYSNINGQSYIAWQWKAGTTSASNTNGTITSTVSANTTAGFSVVTYTGTGANATVGHGLGVAPKMIIVKDRSVSTNWAVYNSSLTSAAYVLLLNLTAAETSASTFWNSTAPTSSVFSIGTSSATNTASENFVAYCFAAVAGYSAFGSFTGNGSTDGPFVYTGFRPRWIMWKNSSTGGTDWTIVDSSRNTYNVANSGLQPNGSYAEASNSNYQIDFLSNGFKLRTTNTEANQSGISIIYAAFAEVPFKFANAR
jgi:hypothetical protein